MSVSEIPRSERSCNLYRHYALLRASSGNLSEIRPSWETLLCRATLFFAGRRSTAYGGDVSLGRLGLHGWSDQPLWVGCFVTRDIEEQVSLNPQSGWLQELPGGGKGSSPGLGSAAGVWRSKEISPVGDSFLHREAKMQSSFQGSSLMGSDPGLRLACQGLFSRVFSGRLNERGIC